MRKLIHDRERVGGVKEWNKSLSPKPPRVDRPMTLSTAPIDTSTMKNDFVNKQ